MWIWINNIRKGIKASVTIISRVVKLENRVTILEDKISKMEIPPKDINEELTYNRTLNVREDKGTGESFCPTCIGNGKRVAVQIKDTYGQKNWFCHNCKSHGNDGSKPNYPEAPARSNLFRNKIW